ncbi:IPT/TIG domain-containing protein [Inquilinus sp. Marseille-Q2685]|uniref:lipase family protein n=1 Tax=Inquilinus sp. Marseille-Q2685 TaxID=2866581 RepID=UPI001CE4154E|nr:IPT/TIG domain-containing protein [Inquilinus sp. Marseille-Q2685]
MPDYSTTTKIMMTLAALASDAADPRPSGEKREHHIARIKQGITTQLADKDLATQGQWKLSWVGLTKDGANLAYIAQGPNDDSGTVYALVLRGTVMDSLVDQLEDLQVGMLVPFHPDGTKPMWPLPQISLGAMVAYGAIVSNTDLKTQLAQLKPDTLYVVGHSLGGAMATTIALYLQQQASAGMLSIGSIRPYTFAAPTAGDKTFAAWFDTQFPSAVCIYNKYDVVPTAWATLASLPENWQKNPFYPGPDSNPPGPGPVAKPDNAVGQQIASMAGNTNGNVYVQPTQQPPLNAGPSPVFLEPYPEPADTDVDKFMQQVGFQHWSNTYLKLLGAPQVPVVVPIASVSPTSGHLLGGTSVTILPPKGQAFTPDSVVDFGTVAAKSHSVASDGSSITAVSPPSLLIGTVDIRVTNIYGTTAAGPSDQFTYTL